MDYLKVYYILHLSPKVDYYGYYKTCNVHISNDFHMSWYAYLKLREDVIMFRLCIVKPYVRDCKRKLFLSDDFQTEKVNLLSNFWKRIIATVCILFQIYWWLPIFETYYMCSIVRLC